MVAVTTSYPGVYVTEVPSGVRTISGAATSVAAFVGRTQRGPVGTPVLVNSYADYGRQFGGLWKDSPVSYAVRDFFANGGGQAVIVRLITTGSDAKKSGATTWTLPASSGNNPLVLVAAEPGSWADRLEVTVTRPSDETSPLFELTAADPDRGIREVFRNLTVSDGPRKVDQVLASDSQLLRVKDGDAAPSAPPKAFPAKPAAADQPTAGLDGTNLATTDYHSSTGTFITDHKGLYALDHADFNLLCVPMPGALVADLKTVYDAALTYCVKRRAVLVVDPPARQSTDQPVVHATGALGGLGLAGERARNAVLYYPRIRQSDEFAEGRLGTFVACGVMAGLIARTDATRGVWKAPAGVDATLSGVSDLDVPLTDAEIGQLNALGINVLRTLPGVGPVSWGARTMRGGDQYGDEYRYLPVRRLALHIEETLFRGTQWVVFEPNAEPLWAQIRLNVGAFLNGLFRQGAFAGATSREAYFVKCDKDTTTAQDVDNGRVNIQVGFAPLRPAEFVVLSLQQIAQA
ncbi:phage tail sheath subtilisin-like domain-containing protein [Cryptosporangium sp. NPDC048952]|uniref:phage tail sheath family protein n=1 Tax=Cryptosporangium sp. NPDC048952 TaxID=3363961 RepID=UPI003714494A